MQSLGALHSVSGLAICFWGSGAGVLHCGVSGTISFSFTCLPSLELTLRLSEKKLTSPTILANIPF